MTTSRPSDDRSRSVAGSVARASLPAIDRALADLAEAVELVPFLALLRDPSIRRPWRETVLDAYARAELDDQARAEHADRAEDAPGEHKDAARADVLDALSGILERAETLAWHLSCAAYMPTLPAPAADADPRPYLDRAAYCLPTAVTGWTNGKDLAHMAADEAAAILRDLESALSLVADGHVVKALCPWCKGGLTRDYTWRVRIMPGGEVGICCESGICQPPSKDVTTWWGGAPVWPFHDWPWLAKRLAHLDARRAAQAAPLVRSSAQGSTGRAGTPTTDTAEAGLLAGRLDTDITPPEGNAA
jgi:hypothetical protein